MPDTIFDGFEDRRQLKNSSILIRRALRDDLPDIVAMLANDALGEGREDPSVPLATAYEKAFEAIEADPNQLLAVADEVGTVVGTMQLTFIPGISRKGSWRGQIEAVRVAGSHRNQGLGERLFEWAFDKFKARGCMLVQLTTDLSRPDAHRFYERMGFEATHKGYKCMLASN